MRSVHSDFSDGHVAHLNRDCASRPQPFIPHPYPGAIVVIQRIFLPLAAIILASPVWASASSISTSTAALSFNGSSGNVTTQPLTITSHSSGAITINALSLSNNAFSNSWVSLPVTLSPGQSLTIKVSAQPETAAMQGTLTIVTSAGNSTVSLTETAAPSTTAHSVSLKWGPPSTGIPTGSYDVDRAVSGSTYFSHIGSTSASVTNWTDYSPQAGQTYQYRVRALDHAGDTGPPSDVITLKIP
jgi:hypothetical protein